MRGEERGAEGSGGAAYAVMVCAPLCTASIRPTLYYRKYLLCYPVKMKILPEKEF